MSALLLSGCGHHQDADTFTVAPGVVFRRDRDAGVQILDIDQVTAKVRPIVVAANVSRLRGNFIGDTHTVREWADTYGAVGGINAGFFGDTYDMLGRRKQLVGLAVLDGRTVAPGSFVASTTRTGERFLRSAVGFDAGGVPEITYATGSPHGPLRRYNSPIALRNAGGDIWQVHSAVACGPRLFAGGVRHIADKEERLVSAGKLPRAFIAFDREQGRPRHLILGRADGMEFSEVAAYLTDYFARVHNSAPREGMCLDGGPSAQLVYQTGANTREDAEPTGVLVPTAILLVPEK